MHGKLMKGRENGEGVQVGKRKDWLNIEEIICNRINRIKQNRIKPSGR